MAIRRPLVMVSGEIQRIQVGDTIDPTLVSSTSDFDATNGEASTITVCQPVYVDGSDTVSLALADAVATANVIGLATEDILTATLGTFASDGIVEATTGEWDAVTGGTGGLTLGAVYFLDPATAGNLTTTPPSTTGQVVTRIGIAMTTTKLKISFRVPILL